MVGAGLTWRRDMGQDQEKAREENSRDGLQSLRGGLLPPFQTDFIHPRELCIVQVLSKPPGFTDEAFCLIF